MFNRGNLFMFVIRRELQLLSRNSFSYLKSISLVFLISFACANFTVISSAEAKQLNKKECKVLKGKLKTLKATPAVLNMSKGFEWVKENVKGDDLLPIKDFLETEEQYKFRCPQPRKKKAPVPKKKKLKSAKSKLKNSNVVKKQANKAKSKPKKVSKPVKKKKYKPKKSSQKPKKTKHIKNSLIKPPKQEPTLFETIFPSSVEKPEKK